MYSMQKTGIVLLLLFVGLTSMMAQPGRGGRDIDPQQMADRQTTRMQEALTLSEAQTAKVAAVNLKYATQLKEVRATAGDDRTAIRTAMQELRAAQQTELMQYLTQEQQARWKEAMAQRPERGRRDGRKGKKKEQPGDGGK